MSCNECKQEICGCARPALGITPKTDSVLRFNLGGVTTEYDFGALVKKNETDTTLSADRRARVLIYRAERHTDSLSGEQLGSILHLGNLGDVDTTGVQTGSTLVYDKGDGCGDGCVSNGAGWKVWNAQDNAVQSASYLSVYDENGNQFSLAEPEHPDQTYLLGWNGAEKLSYFQPTVASTKPADSYTLFMDGKSKEIVAVKDYSSGDGGGAGTITEEIKVTGVEVGGVSDGTVFAAGTAIEGILNQILVKTIAAEYTAPTVNITVSPSVAVFEKGVSTNFTLTANFTQNDAGIAQVYAWNGGGAGKNKQLTITDSTTASVEVSFAEGAIKNNNMGDPSPAGHIEAGKVSATTSIKAVDPIYSGAGTFTGSNGTKEVIAKPTTKTYSFTTNNDTVFIASPYQIGTILDNNGFNATGSFVHSETDYTRQDGSTVRYHIYTSGAATITNFKYTFTFL